MQVKYLLSEMIKNKDVDGLKEIIKKYNLDIKDGKVVSKKENTVAYKQQEIFWDQRNTAKKIMLNATYGALLNEHLRFYDGRLGQSTTLTGRCIVQHMNAKINEIITGKYDYMGEGVQYSDTDSVHSNSVINTNLGNFSVEDLFDLCPETWTRGEKEYGSHPDLLVLTYDPDTNAVVMNPIKYIYRHKVSKPKWKIIDEVENEVTVTGDHSLMVERDGDLIEAKPKEIKKDDVLISVLHDEDMEIHRAPISKIKHLEDFEDEYVYDIGMASGEPYFFANNILVHNSSYFSAYEVLKDHEDYKDVEWTKEFIIDLYDSIADATNETFPAFMQKTFNTNLERGSLIKAGRELVASTGLFIKKKKYAVLMYDKEGTRLDANGKPGKLKVMGLDLKRSDTPKFMQKFLESLLMDILTNADQKKMYQDVKVFREAFKERPSWEKGSPKKVKDLSKFVKRADIADKAGVFGKIKQGDKLRVNMPGHVRASINWNKLCEMYDDHYSIRIVDGTRIIVCKLRPNSMRMDSVAFPIDQPHLPQWFKDLPFDDAEMENVIINKKLMNLVGVLSWDLSETIDRMDDDLFSFDDDEPSMKGHNGGPSWDGGDEGDDDEDE